MRTEVSRIQRRLGTTTVYVTHDQTEAMTLGDRVAVMRSGLLQQVGSPKELYDTPLNLFVAGFIGSPAMNFMAGTLQDNQLHTTLGNMPISGELAQALSGLQGREVIVGLRPENFEDASLVQPDLRGHGITFGASIDVLESMGSDVFVYFTQEIEQGVNSAELEELARDSGRADTGGTGDTVVARLDAATRVREGESAELWADVRKMHVFDPASGRNLSLDTGGGAGAAPAASGGAAAPRGVTLTDAEPAPAAEDTATAGDTATGGGEAT
jgi:multiple sugar transport system ATP-binding protein